jgi:hypothetical protein
MLLRAASCVLSLVASTVVGLETVYEVKRCETWNADGTSCTKYNDKAVNDDLKQYYEESFEGQHNCAVSTRKPGKPRSLSFCHKFNDEACCAPVMDDENTEMFGMLTGLGLSCRLRGDIREDPIAKWYCMNCDPEQPQYVRQILKADPEPDNGEDNPHAEKNVILVCQDWAADGFGVNPVLDGPGNRYNECGLLKSSPCLGVNGEQIPDRDRYTCGDDLVYPNSYAQHDDDGVTDVVASLEAFMNEASMGPPLLDENFAFHIIPEDSDGPIFCTKDELQQLYKPEDTDGDFNPRCLRTEAQLTGERYSFWENSNRNTTVEDITFREYYCEYLQGDGSPDGSCFVDDDHKERVDCSVGATRSAKSCCCAKWEQEQCFNGGSALRPAHLAWLVMMALFVVIVGPQV